MKKVKLILPVLAVMFALVGALATGVPNKSSLDPVEVVLVPNDCETPAGHCSNEPGMACESSPDVPYLIREDEESCDIPAVGDFTL